MPFLRLRLPVLATVSWDDDGRGDGRVVVRRTCGKEEATTAVHREWIRGSKQITVRRMPKGWMCVVSFAVSKEEELGQK